MEKFLQVRQKKQPDLSLQKHLRPASKRNVNEYIDESLFVLFNNDYPFVDVIKDIVTNDRSLIEGSKNLIIDISGNSGVTDNAYEMLFPYIMNNPIRNMGVEYLATQTLVNGLQGYIKTARSNKEKQG